MFASSDVNTEHHRREPKYHMVSLKLIKRYYSVTNLKSANTYNFGLMSKYIHKTRQPGLPD